MTSGIAHAIVIKRGNIFFLSDADGCVPLNGDHGLGLYYHDCRFLCGYEFRLGATRLNTLVADDTQGDRAYLQYTNAEIQIGEGEHIARDELGISLTRVLDSATLTLHEIFDFQSYGLTELRFPFQITFQATFEDIFTVRGLWTEPPGQLEPPRWIEDALHFSYHGGDGLARSLIVQLAPAPASNDDTTAHFEIVLPPRGRQQIRVSVVIAEAQSVPDGQAGAQHHFQREDGDHALRSPLRSWSARMTQLQSDSLLLNNLVSRSLVDIAMLRSNLAQFEYFAAGVPWFATLFGRDSIITALEMLAFDSQIAEQTLRVLAHYQGNASNHWREEQPGKMLHEVRVGELARMGEVPHTPYYGTVDATPLFLILVARHAAWTGDLSLFHELRENIERALTWIDHYGDSNGDGYVDYSSMHERGLVNQGWKDSGDAIVNSDGELAEPPIALVEVQAYVYFAKSGLAALFERAGDTERAAQLRHQAEDLYSHFNSDFWLDELGFYALCLQKNAKPAAVLTSNPGHVLWAGIVDPAHAASVVRHLMSDELFSGWGVRTLARSEKRYNPLGYHLGTVWPHDNAILAAGMRRYGFFKEMRRLVGVLFDAAMRFDLYRLPELFAGIERGVYSTPVRYPVACHPQAWSEGAVPFLMEVLLGLEPEAFEHRLRIKNPMLPDPVDRLALKRLKIGRAHVDLDFERTSGGSIATNVAKVDGELEVLIEPNNTT